MFYISLPTLFRPDNTGPYTTLHHKKAWYRSMSYISWILFCCCKILKTKCMQQSKTSPEVPTKRRSIYAWNMNEERRKQEMGDEVKKGIRKKRRLTKIDREYWNLSKEWFSGKHDCDQQNVESTLCIVYSDLLLFCLIGTSSVIGY